ncbi:hypothetical protein DV454_004049 [Geotrichum candidum]|nr:hypothetical protein DV454_004049 [Geotrichum candidum]
MINKKTALFNLRKNKQQLAHRLSILNKSFTAEQQTITDLTSRLRETKASIQARREYIAAQLAKMRQGRRDSIVTVSNISTDKTVTSTFQLQIQLEKVRIANDLSDIFVIDLIPNFGFNFTICGVPLPDYTNRQPSAPQISPVIVKELGASEDDLIAAAYGFAAQLLTLLSYYFEVPLRYPIQPYGMLMDSRNGDESVDESEIELAEKIIQESYEDDGDNDDEYIPQKKRIAASTSSSNRRSATSSSRQSEKSPSAPSPKKPRKQAARRSPAAGSSTSASTNGELSDEDFKGTDDMAALFLDGYEGYFDQHKTREKISTTPFSRAPALEFSEFINYVDQSRGYFKDSKDFLTSLYRTMFTQWFFELSQGYSLLYYGIGSKRNLLLEFVTSTIPESVPVLVVNGYNPATNFKELLNSLIHILVDDSVTKLPKNTPDLLQTVVRHLDSKPKSQPESHDSVELKLPKVVILIHNIDGESLRSDKSQSYLSTLASIPEIWLVASCDHINAPVMWDAAKLALYNFLWHDLTTYDSYAVETSFEDPLSLGKIRTAAGNKGVKYVLSSLTLKARGLYRVLICHQIETMISELHGTGNIEDQRNTPGSVQFGIEFKLLYQKCVEEFLVSNELNFRTMLTEFLDHKMAVLTKDSSGTEIVYVPYTKETIENILEQDLID